MKKILLIAALIISVGSFAQKAAKDTSTKAILMDSLCNCFGKKDLSKVKDMQGFQGEFIKCFMEPTSMGLFMKLAADRGIDMNDQEAGQVLGAEIGKEIFTKCTFLMNWIEKMAADKKGDSKEVAPKKGN